MILIHREYLKTSIDKCLLGSNSNQLGDLIKKMMSVIEDLYWMCVVVE